MGDEAPDEERPSEGSAGSDGSGPAADEGSPATGDVADQTVPETDLDDADAETDADARADADADEADSDDETPSVDLDAADGSDPPAEPDAETDGDTGDADTPSYGSDLTEEEVAELESAWKPREEGESEEGASADEAADSDADPDADVDLPQPPERAKSDGGYADGTGTGTGSGTADSEITPPSVDEYDYDDEEFAPDGPASDQEMPLADHIEEMIRRLGVVLVVMAVVSGIAFPFGAEIIKFLWYSVIVSDPVPAPRVYSPLALVLARLKVATLAGFILGLPVFVYETYLFMRPGLYPKERRYYLASVPTSLVLATVGVVFAYFLVLPALFTYFLYYSEGVTVIAFGLTETFDLMVLMLGWFALIFQIPLFVLLATMMGLVSRVWLADRRLYFWGAFLGIAFLFAPDPTGMAPIIVAATMIVLFEGTLFLQKWSRRGWDAVFG
jgi:sec-independent protein translocase protein TatC